MYAVEEEIGVWGSSFSDLEDSTTQDTQVAVVARQSSRRGYGIIRRFPRRSMPISNVVTFPSSPSTSSVSDEPEASVSPNPSGISWLVTASSKLFAIAGLPDNWDTYGSPSISSAVLGQSMRLLSQLSNLGFPAPKVLPSSGGGMQFEWEVEAQELEIEILPNGSTLFLFVDALGDELEGDLDVENEELLNQLCRRLSVDCAS